MGWVTTVQSRSELESSLAWADGALLAIDQRLLPHELRWLRITGRDLHQRRGGRGGRCDGNQCRHKRVRDDQDERFR